MGGWAELLQTQTYAFQPSLLWFLEVLGQKNLADKPLFMLQLRGDDRGKLSSSQEIFICSEIVHFSAFQRQMVPLRK